jgi:hypothetical protein
MNLFSKSASQSNWSNPAIVGDPLNPTFNNNSVIVSSNTLLEFQSYANKLKFNFTYDHAVGLTRYQLFKPIYSSGIFYFL